MATVNFALLIQNHDFSYADETFDAADERFFKDFLPLLDAQLLKEIKADGKVLEKIIQSDDKIKHHLKTHSYIRYYTIRLNTPDEVKASFEKAVANTGMIQVYQALPPIWCVAHSVMTENAMVVELKLWKP